VVGLAVELAQFGVQVGAHVAHHVLAEGQHLVGGHGPPVFGDENQLGVQVVDGAGAAAHVGIEMAVPHVGRG
jgi:hypothetical protein